MSSEEKSMYPVYNAHVVQDILMYEDYDRETLLEQMRYRHQRCMSRRWKLLLWIGIILIILGMLAIVVSYIIPSVEWITASGNTGDDLQLYNKLKECNIITYMCKVIGFLNFCIGGVLLTLSLLFSSCFVCNDRDQSEELFVNENGGYTDRTDKPDYRLQTMGPASFTVQNAQVSEMLRQEINTEALSATLI